ncbi:MAG TPA: LysM peptidoglycan-binding domain-containing M23 family metallopeptidase, partial [Candidatus Paceibacterota bacterium]
LQGKSIQPGDQLIILPITGIEYAVQKGDTIASIAKKFKSDAGDIAQYNDLSGDASLSVGSQIIIPNGEAPASVSTPTIAKKSSGSSVAVSKKKKKVGAEPYLGGSGPELDGYYSWPVDGGVITQGLHGWNGVDIGASIGTNILAAADGTVIIAKNNGAWNGGYGNYVVISHPNGTQTLYGHMSRVLVGPGESVSEGEVIGKVGSTGESTGPHLHFEVRGAANPFAALGVGYSN